MLLLPLSQSEQYRLYRGGLKGYCSHIDVRGEFHAGFRKLDQNHGF